MKLQTLAAKPKLTKIELDSEDIIESYGEPIEFYVYDRQNMDTFMTLASLDEKAQIGELSAIVGELIYDEDGNKILENDSILPMNVMLKVVEKTVTVLGNSLTQTLPK